MLLQDHFLYKHLNVIVYPTTATNTEADPKPQKSTDPFRNCPGCRGKQHSSDPRHNRVPGECRYPHVTTIEWSCPGCKAHRPAAHDDHTYDPDHCRWATAEVRGYSQRKGKHPRSPAKPASQDPSARPWKTPPPLPPPHPPPESFSPT